MAADRAQSTLKISLIIFVMIAFILAVATYYGFQQRGKERQAATTAQAEMTKANRDRETAQEEARRIREVLGSDKDTADAVEAERNELFDRKFAGFNEQPRSLLRLVQWLDDAIKAKDADIKRLDAENKQIQDEKKAAVENAQSLQTKAEDDLRASREEQTKLKEQFDQQWAGHTEKMKRMEAEHAKLSADSETLRKLLGEIADFETIISSTLRQNFATAEPDGRLRFLKTDLSARERVIQELNATLARLRVANQSLQEFIREANPEEVARAVQLVRQRTQLEPKDKPRNWSPPDDQIDGFDGRVASVNSFDRTVLIVCDSTAGMRPGLMLSVYDPDDPRPQSGDRKGVVEVESVDGPTLARARIRSDSITSPILAGDGVATSLWSPGEIREIVVVGYVRVGPDRRQDTAEIRDLIERNGGRVVDGVSPQTALVVDGGPPPAADVQPLPDTAWTPADEANRRKALERAKELGIRVVGLDGLLDMLGTDRESLDGRRLPNELGAAP